MSASVIARRIAATPARPASEAWQVIVDLVAPDSSDARTELERASGVAVALIALEAPRESPIAVYGVGPRFRIYCVYDEEAILGEGLSEDALPWSPVAGRWHMSLPCSTEDLAWFQAELAGLSERITARDSTEDAPDNDEEPAQKASRELGPVDREAFLRS